METFMFLNKAPYNMSLTIEKIIEVFTFLMGKKR